MTLRESIAKMPRKLKLYYAHFAITWALIAVFDAIILRHGASYGNVAAQGVLMMNMLYMYWLILRERRGDMAVVQSSVKNA